MNVGQSKSFRDWMKRQYGADFETRCQDLVEHGASAGFSGMIYYSETTALYEEFEDEIWDALSDDAAEMGIESPMKLIVQFHGADLVNSDAQFRNLLVWYLAERVAREVTDQQEADREWIDGVAEVISAIGASTIWTVEADRDEEREPSLEVRLQWVDGDWRIWSGDNQYDTDHRGAWGFGTIRPAMTQEEYRTVAEEMVREARDAEAMFG